VRKYEVAEINMARNRLDFGGNLAFAYLFLPKMYLTIHATFMQVYSHVFGICPSGTYQTWSFQGDVSGYQTHLKMSSLGREWL
jgi:hypothetical protein